MARRTKQPADTAPASEWNEYDAKVINAFLDDALAADRGNRTVIARLRDRIADFVNR